MKLFNYSFAMTKLHVLSTHSGLKTLLLVSLILAFILSSSSAQAWDCLVGPGEIKFSQCVALQQLYYSTDGPNWRIEGNPVWPNGPKCDDYGIQCELDSRDNTYDVVAISLGGVGMKGELPQNDCFSDLPHLRLINMSGNSLTGQIPDAIAGLDFLHTLHLSDNKLDGDIPEGLLGSKTDNQFPSINISNNNLQGKLPQDLGNDTIAALLVHNNPKLSCPIPATYIQLNELPYLNYEGTKICEPQDQAMQNWLQGLDFHYGTRIPCDELTPCSLDASDGTSRVNIIVTWEGSVLANYYHLERADGEGPDFEFNEIKELEGKPLRHVSICNSYLGGCRYYDKNIAPIKKYSYRVKGCRDKDLKKCSGYWSNIDSGYKGGIAPFPILLLLLMN